MNTTILSVMESRVDRPVECGNSSSGSDSSPGSSIQSEGKLTRLTCANYNSESSPGSSTQSEEKPPSIECANSDETISPSISTSSNSSQQTISPSSSTDSARSQQTISPSNSASSDSSQKTASLSNSTGSGRSQQPNERNAVLKMHQKFRQAFFNVFSSSTSSSDSDKSINEHVSRLSATSASGSTCSTSRDETITPSSSTSSNSSQQTISPSSSTDSASSQQTSNQWPLSGKEQRMIRLRPNQLWRRQVSTIPEGHDHPPEHEISSMENTTSFVVSGGSVTSFNDLGAEHPVNYPDTHRLMQNASPSLQRGIDNPTFQYQGRSVTDMLQSYVDDNSEDSPDTNCFGKLKGRDLIQRIVCFAILIVIAASGAVAIIFSSYAAVEETCIFLHNELVCPLQENTRIEVMVPHSHLETGDGRIVYNLKNDTDVTIQGFNIRVEKNKVYVHKHPYECIEEGEHSVRLLKDNVTQREHKLSLHVTDFNDTIMLVTTPYTNATDKKEYVQFTCSGFHQCGEVVMKLELNITDFGTYDKPMNCSRTNSEGEVLPNYGYTCTCSMTAEIFRRTDNLKCKPTVESLQNVKTDPLPQRSVNVTDATKTMHTLEKGQNETIQWNVLLPNPKELPTLETELNRVLHSNQISPNGRIYLSVTVKEHVATYQVKFRPVTCTDNGTWLVQLPNGESLDKEINVTGLSAFTQCPKKIAVTVGQQLNLHFRSCIPDAAKAYFLNLFGRTTLSGNIPKERAIEIADMGTNFRGSIVLNELSVTLEIKQITCADHGKNFQMMILGNPTEDTVQQFNSRADIIGRYGATSTGDNFIENRPATVNLWIQLGCRPDNYTIHNRTNAIPSANLTEDVHTGEKMFSQTFSFPQMSMADNGTTLYLHSSFIDDEGMKRNVSIQQDILVVSATFCNAKSPGCNYDHPYKASKFIACGHGVVASIGDCPDDLEFVESSCTGQCCPKASTSNCQQA
ncbi:uncharacterized protein [Argopecten irradians]|uniref:uncharacterized protein n=1 Tax=Argopecten irradians TaxID=31199 RepID=UPI00372271CD